MNINKFVLFIMMTVILLSTLNVAASNDVVMYSVDGRQRIVSQNEVSTALLDGWYEYPVCILYAPDGREEIINLIEKDYYLEKGFLEDITDYQILYSESGEQTLVHKNDVSLHVSNGWYEAPVCYVYDKYGNSSLIYESEIDYYRSLGWSLSNAQKKKIAFEYICDFIKVNDTESLGGSFYGIDVNDNVMIQDNHASETVYCYDLSNNVIILAHVNVIGINIDENNTFNGYTNWNIVAIANDFLVFGYSMLESNGEYNYFDSKKMGGILPLENVKVNDELLDFNLYVEGITKIDKAFHASIASYNIKNLIHDFQSYLLDHNAEYTLEDLGFVFE